MNRKELEAAVVQMLSLTLRKNSQFYAEDLQAIKVVTASKTDTELTDTYARWNAVNSVTQTEINQNCQAGFLKKILK
jgi:hypothetical protein